MGHSTNVFDEMDTAHWVYFGFLIVPAGLVALTTLAGIWATFIRIVDPSTRPRKYRVYKEHPEVCYAHLRPSLTVLLPCYLPNEQYILKETILHLIEKLRYPKPFKLVVCYNTPKALEFEEELAKYHGRTFPNGRSVEVRKVVNSTSKAHNLNAAIEDVDTELTAIYDADHHPDPDSLMISTAHLIAQDADCVQGSTYLRTVGGLLSWFVQAEFFITHFLLFPVMQLQSGVGIFGGSNAVWKTSVLQTEQFRHDVQTEDIELTTRMLLKGTRIALCPESRSGELPPASAKALCRQRLRWAIGWDQVSLMHKNHIFTSPNLTVRQRVGLFNILLMRYLLFITTIIATFPVVGGLVALAVGYGEPLLLRVVLDVLVYCFAVSAGLALVLLINAPRENDRGLHPVLAFLSDVGGIVFFFAVGPLYLLWQIVLVVISLKRIALKQDGGWVVTARAGAGTTATKTTEVTTTTTEQTIVVELSEALARVTKKELTEREASVRHAQKYGHLAVTVDDEDYKSLRLHAERSSAAAADMEMKLSARTPLPVAPRGLGSLSQSPAASE